MENQILNKSEEKYIITSNRLKVEFAAPGSVYSCSRFDWTGFITQVTLDGRHTYCVPESLVEGQGCGGIGLCNEFGINKAVGYEETEPGEKFPKLGVGLLTKPDQEAYVFHRKYEIEPFPVKIIKGTDEIEILSESIPCNGYAVELKKVIKVFGNRLRIDYILRNLGSKAVLTNEYVHNFVGINGHNIGPGYRLKVNGMPDVTQKVGKVLVDGAGLTWETVPQSVFFCELAGEYSESGLRWELTHEPSGTGMREYGDFPVETFNLWGTTHVVSPEIYIKIDVKPGETQSWSREFEFYDARLD